jgi:hypothetical protein
MAGADDAETTRPYDELARSGFRKPRSDVFLKLVAEQVRRDREDATHRKRRERPIVAVMNPA